MLRPAVLAGVLAFVLLALAAYPAQEPPRRKPPPKEKPSADATRKAQEADAELEHAVQSAGNDRTALVRNLKQFLEKFPETPRRPQVYRAIVEASLQLGDLETALEFTERLIVLRSDDPSLMLLAVDLLERQGDDLSLTKAVGYTTRVIDGVEKAGAQGRPADVTPADWETEQKRLLMSLYLIRGRLELQRGQYDEAGRDLEKSYGLLPNPAAAMRLGELAEVRGQYEAAIEYYAAAFTLPQDYGIAIDRRQLRRKLGNAWRLVHGSEAGLGEKLLSAYDKSSESPASATPSGRNAEAKELSAFVVRKFEGGDLAFSSLHSKVVVVSFWATWCLPCREVAVQVGRAAEHYRGQDGVAFLAVNCDEDEALARAYAEREKLRVPAVFSDGLAEFFSMKGLPTVIVLDRDGRIIYRGEGFSGANLEKELTTAIERGLAPPSQAKP